MKPMLIWGLKAIGKFFFFFEIFTGCEGCRLRLVRWPLAGSDPLVIGTAIFIFIRFLTFPRLVFVCDFSLVYICPLWLCQSAVTRFSSAVNDPSSVISLFGTPASITALPIWVCVVEKRSSHQIKWNNIHRIELADGIVLWGAIRPGRPWKGPPIPSEQQQQHKKLVVWVKKFVDGRKLEDRVDGREWKLKKKEGGKKAKERMSERVWRGASGAHWPWRRPAAFKQNRRRRETHTNREEKRQVREREKENSFFFFKWLFLVSSFFFRHSSRSYRDVKRRNNSHHHHRRDNKRKKQNKKRRQKGGGAVGAGKKSSGCRLLDIIKMEATLTKIGEEKKCHADRWH